MVGVENLTAGDPAARDSPYRDAFFHFSAMPPDLDRGTLPNRDMIFEFTLVPSQQDPGKMAASEIALVYDYGDRRMPVHVDRPEPRLPEREPPRPPDRIPDVEDYIDDE